MNWTLSLLNRGRGWSQRLSLAASGVRVSPSTILRIGRGGTLTGEPGAVVYRYGSILIEQNGAFSIGRRSVLMQGCEVAVGRGAQLQIGAGVYIGAYSNLRCVGRICIGDGTRIAQMVSIIDANYDMRGAGDGLGSPLPEEIAIGKGVWIGANAVILPGVRINGGAVIGAGSVVTKDVPPRAIWAGNPAKGIGFR